MGKRWGPAVAAAAVAVTRPAIESTVGLASRIANRNPRNLEKMHFAYKPDGYHLEKPGRSYWHNLEVIPEGRNVTARVVHYMNGPVIEASTREWAIKKQLFSGNDTCAYINLARVLADRCLKFGIYEVACNLNASPEGKLDKFVHKMFECGVRLREPKRYTPRYPTERQLEKPWEVFDDPE